MRRHRRAGFAAQDVVEARERAAFVVQAVEIEERVADPPARETIDDQVELVLGGALRRRAVPGEDAVVEAMDVVDEGQLELSGPAFCLRCDTALPNRVMMAVSYWSDDEEQRAPFQRR